MDWEHGRRAVGISAAHWEPEGLTDYNPKSLTRSVAPGCWCVIFSSSTVNGNRALPWWSLYEQNVSLCAEPGPHLSSVRRCLHVLALFPTSLVSIETYLPCWYSVFKVHALVACFRSKVLGNYVHDCSRFTVGSDRTIFYPGTLWICQLSSCGPVFSMRPLLTFPLLRNRIQTCRISARLYSTSVFSRVNTFISKTCKISAFFKRGVDWNDLWGKGTPSTKRKGLDPGRTGKAVRPVTAHDHLIRKR